MHPTNSVGSDNHISILLLHAARMTTSTFNVAAQARRVADAAAARAGVRVLEIEQMDGLREVSQLWEAVWGRSAEGVPLNSELLRSLVHAGGAVTVARDRSDRLAGAAALVLAEQGSTYSLIAAAGPEAVDRGIGHALKLHQRAWALDRERATMRWTFDPLVGRNARFNLTKLGATAEHYLSAFYGRMSDDINAGDEADRLVAHWQLAAPGVVAASEGTADEPDEPARTSTVVLLGPDGEPAYVTAGELAWCRVPRDVVALRRTDPAATARWRSVVREAFADAAARGLVATGVTRSGWYCLSSGDRS
jgi:predicted GNAT superfamily acetyltransferase